MLLKHYESNALIRIVDVDELLNPHVNNVKGRSQSGEEEQEISEYPKSSLRFTSGECLPRCWTHPNHQGWVVGTCSVSRVSSMNSRRLPEE